MPDAKLRDLQFQKGSQQPSPYRCRAGEISAQCCKLQKKKKKKKASPKHRRHVKSMHAVHKSNGQSTLSAGRYRESLVPVAVAGRGAKRDSAVKKTSNADETRILRSAPTSTCRTWNAERWCADRLAGLLDTTSPQPLHCVAPTTHIRRTRGKATGTERGLSGSATWADWTIRKHAFCCNSRSDKSRETTSSARKSGRGFGAAQLLLRPGSNRQANRFLHKTAFRQPPPVPRVRRNHYSRLGGRCHFVVTVP